ncbi:ADP-ribosylation factor-like protein 13B [Acropora cervicornis]|uniref:ADP-ribosylation factor-like protein 13B n=1 Tax=Acropora cervicornis TaxID=6130 RepID=A0AAD9R0U8_ACRCE|nr:ADP-ribosylation factor-like protein 13B [Acropora cervicornis]
MLSLMANCFTWIKQRREPSKKVTLLMVGLDNAGKTSTVADLTGESTDGIVPSIGFQNSSFSLYKFQVTLFDVGGGPRIRSIWKIYYADVRSYS